MLIVRIRPDAVGRWFQNGTQAWRRHVPDERIALLSPVKGQTGVDISVPFRVGERVGDDALIENLESVAVSRR